MRLQVFKKRVLVTVIGLAAAWLVTGCSVDGQITDGTVKTINPTMAQMSGFVAGGYQRVTTTNGYTVSASLGSPYAEPVENKTNGGYTVYSSIQGNINSETYNVISR